MGKLIPMQSTRVSGRRWVLVSAGADLLGIETMTDLAEAVLAVKAARAVSGMIPVSATVTFERTR